MDNKLRYKRLSPILYNKNFIEEDSLCNYEIYMRELLNSSDYFLGLSGGEKYNAPESEEKGQDDATSMKYSIDFKLAESTTMIEMKKVFSSSVHKLCDGVIIQGGAEKQGESIGTVLHGSLRQIKCLEDIDILLESQSSYIKLENRKEELQNQIILDDIKRFIKVISKDKNLLLFMPLNFYLNDNGDNKIGEECIKEALYKDFGILFRYRFERYSSKDTFLSCIFNNSLLIFKYGKDKLCKVDSVCLECSPTFEYLIDTYGLEME
jgi:hypothetical protein